MKAIYGVLLILSALCLANAGITSVTQNVRGFQVVSDTATTATQFRVSFVSLTGSPLTQGTQYTITPATAVAGSTWTISGLDTGIYSVNDNNGSGAWRNATTSCLVPDTPAITLVTANSNTVADTDGRLLLKLRFAESWRYRSIAYAFNGAISACNSNISNTVAGTKQSWVRTAPTTTCTDPYTDYTQDFNNALTICNFQRDETDATNTVFSATVLIYTTDTGDVIRGIRYERNLQTSVTIRIAFQTNITAQTSSMQIYGSRITQSTIVSQTWNPSTFVATLSLFTSVQFPYQFRSPSWTTTPPNFNSPNIVATNPDPVADKLGNAGGQTNRARCVVGNDPNNLANASSTVCNQFWTITISRSTACTGSNQVTLAGTWGIRFDVTCPGYFSGSCSVPDPKNDSITFETNSDNYCPVLISTQAATASMAVFQDSGFATAQTQFVFGTFSYFRVTVTAPILMDHVAIESVVVTSGASSFLTTGNALGTNVLYNRAYTTAAAWFGNSTTTPTLYALLNGVRANDPATTSPDMTVSDNQDGNTAALTKRAATKWRWNSLTSAASGDNPTTTVVQINLRIRYRNQSTVSYPDERITITKAFNSLDTDAAQVSATFGVVGTGNVGGTGNSGAASSSSSSVGLALSVVGIAAGVVGIIALVSVFTVYMLRHQRARSKEQMASIQLSSTTDLTASA